jgi:hypothetical protein
MNDVKLSSMDRRCLEQMSGLRNNGANIVGHKDLSELLEVSNPKLLNACLSRLAKVGLLKYEGWKEDQHVYSLTTRGLAVAISIYESEERPRKVKVQEKTKHLGITTTEKETTVTPPPSSLIMESKLSAQGALIDPGLSSIQGALTQEDRKTIEFKQEENNSRLETPEKKRRLPKGVDYV